MTNNLCYVPLHFIAPQQLTSAPMFQEISVPALPAIPNMSLNWNLWHTHMGHPDGDSVRHLPLVATSVKVNSNSPLNRCEACIMSKHTRKPHLPSEA